MANTLGILARKLLFPTPFLAYKIIKLSNGLVDFNSIYLPFMEVAEDVNNSLNEEG